MAYMVKSDELKDQFLLRQSYTVANRNPITTVLGRDATRAVQGCPGSFMSVKLTNATTEPVPQLAIGSSSEVVKLKIVLENYGARAVPTKRVQLPLRNRLLFAVDRPLPHPPHPLMRTVIRSN
jgi:hypothetical protein